MDQFFGDDSPPKKPEKKNQNNNQHQNKRTKQDEGPTNTKKQQGNQIDKEGAQQQVKKRRDRARNKRNKEEQKKIEESQKKINEELELPLVLNVHRSIIDSEDTQMNLEDFIQFMYPENKNANKKNRNIIIRSFEKEDDYGNIEYKLKLVKPTQDRIEHLATQMKFRVKEGRGEAYYRIGVQDDGRPTGLVKQEMYQSLRTICILANKIHANVTVVIVAEGIKGNIVELMVTKDPQQGVKLEIRLLLMGEPGSGKSTLLGVIKSGQNDNGKGYSRTKVFTHKDQFMSGITQTKSHHVIAFDSKGKLFTNQTMLSVQSWLQNSSKILSFIDVGGHKQKQVVSSLCSFFPQYALWVVSGLNETQNTSCIELAKIFNLPLIVVVTHLDKLNADSQMETVMRIKDILKKLYPEKTASVIKQMENAVLFSVLISLIQRITSTQDVIPIFLISSVTGRNIDLLINFFNLLTSTSQLRNNQDLHSQFLISNKYNPEKSLVLAGTVIKGTIKKGQILHLGPDIKGTFRAVQVDSIQCMRVPVKLAKCGQVCTIAIKLLSYAKQWLEKQPNGIRRGMVLIQSKNNPKATHEFTASFIPYSDNNQEVKITAKYQPVVNYFTTRQICDIIIMDNNANEDFDELECTLDLKMKKKKSRSIDMFGGKSKNPSHHSSASTIKIQMKKNSTAEQKSEQQFTSLIQKKKQSVDLTSNHSKQLHSPEQSQQSPTLKKVTKLQPIQQTKQQGKLKKKKIDRDVEIKFGKNQPTSLRLRFKYNPQYLQVGQKLVINQLKLIGKVLQLHY